MQPVSMDSFISEYHCTKWMEYLEKYKIKKELIFKYNIKKALIQALRQLGINEKFSSNEVLLQFLTMEYLKEVPPLLYDSTLEAITCLSRDRLEQPHRQEFERLVAEYVSLLQEKIVCSETENICKVSRLSIDSEKQPDKDQVMHIRNQIKEYYFRNHQVELSEVCFDKAHQTTTI